MPTQAPAAYHDPTGHTLTEPQSCPVGSVYKAEVNISRSYSKALNANPLLRRITWDLLSDDHTLYDSHYAGAIESAKKSEEYMSKYDEIIRTVKCIQSALSAHYQRLLKSAKQIIDANTTLTNSIDLMIANPTRRKKASFNQ